MTAVPPEATHQKEDRLVSGDDDDVLAAGQAKSAESPGPIAFVRRYGGDEEERSRLGDGFRHTPDHSSPQPKPRIRVVMVW
jgi:hypothetical protein